MECDPVMSRAFWIPLIVALALLPGFSRADDEPNIESKVALCASCHGENGVPKAANAPVLWGQTEGYIYIQLRDLKNKVRLSPAMNAIASTLSREEMFALAKYYANKPWPNLDQPAAAASDSRTAQTANSAVGCTGCHLGGYQGTGTAPRLAGQIHDYLLASMLAFRDGSRANNPGMTNLMNSASVDDLKAMAAYLAGL